MNTHTPKHRGESAVVGTAGEMTHVKVIIPRHMACNTSIDGRPCWPCRTGLANHTVLTTKRVAA